jgi:hypothetical protein
MKKVTPIICGAVAVLALSGCIDGSTHRGPRYDGYYDGSYGAYHGGYWASDGYFYYSDDHNNYHRDDSRHFRREHFDGGQPINSDHDHDRR